MKKIFTLAAAIWASFSLWAATVDDLATISADYTVYFEDVVTSNVSAGTLITDYVLSQIANSYKANQGTDATVGKKYCLRVKSTSQDVLAFKVSSSCTLVLYANRATDRTPYLDTKVAARGESSITGTPTATDGTKGYVTYSIPAAGTYYIIGNGSDCYLAGLEFSGFCTDPELTVLPTEGTGFVGDPIDIAVTSKNQSKPIIPAVTVDGVAAVYGTDYTFSASTGLVQATPLKAGTFEITFSQASNDTYCAAEESAIFVISEKTPVASVTIDGPTAAYVGEAVTFTATAANASDYAWTVNGVDANTNAAEFTYTPAAAGEYSIVCSARNKFNAAEEWIASEAKVLTASNVSGEIIKVELTSGTAATVTGILGGTADANLSSNKKMDKGKYFGFTLAKGAFAEGDTVVINLSASGSNYPCLFADKNKETLLYLATETSTDLEYKIVLPAAADGLTSLYFARDADDATYKWNPTFTSVSVIRPKAVKETSEALKGIVVEGNAIAAEDVDLIKSKENHTIGYKTAFVTAPEVVFTKTVTTTYEDDSQATKDVEVAATVVADGEYWKATAEINSITYTLIYDKATSFSVVYMFGEEKLGEELVAANGNPAEYETYQAIKLAAFKGWYSDKALETAVEDMSAEVITADKIYYAKFEYKYSQSVNISKWILENGAGKGATDKSTALINLLGSNYYTSNFAWENGNLELDSLNDEKTDRNEPYLGLKVKKAGAMFRLRLAPGSFVNIKIGAYKGILQVAINDGEFADAVLTDGVYHYEATGEDLVSFKMKDGNAVVLQQLMINESVQEVLLPWTITCSDTENGSLAADKKVAYKGEEVKLTVTPNAGYQIASVTVNGEPLAADGEGNYVFEMLNEKVTVAATFSISTALDNTEAEGKAAKVVRDGQLLILKNGVLYNAQGAIVK
ncbi:MAG: hypothetical protein IJ920_10470 [Paludibacteraceae bacterium]|nr:hypothetical protein [Paludibacteraceae bacterium]